jgi:hypothetical protein
LLNPLPQVVNGVATNAELDQVEGHQVSPSGRAQAEKPGLPALPTATEAQAAMGPSASD